MGAIAMVAPNRCDPNPCKNAQACSLVAPLGSVTANQVTCACGASYSGSRCEECVSEGLINANCGSNAQCTKIAQSVDVVKTCRDTGAGERHDFNWSSTIALSYEHHRKCELYHAAVSEQSEELVAVRDSILQSADCESRRAAFQDFTSQVKADLQTAQQSVSGIAIVYASAVAAAGSAPFSTADNTRAASTAALPACSSTFSTKHMHSSLDTLFPLEQTQISESGSMSLALRNWMIVAPVYAMCEPAVGKAFEEFVADFQYTDSDLTAAEGGHARRMLQELIDRRRLNQGDYGNVWKAVKSIWQ